MEGELIGAAIIIIAIVLIVKYIKDNRYNQTYTDKPRLTHRKVAYEFLYDRWTYSLPFKKYVVHHKDKNKLNNSVDNLQILLPKEHSKLHGYS